LKFTRNYVVGYWRNNSSVSKKDHSHADGRASPLQWVDLSSADSKAAKELHDVSVNVCEDKTAVAYRTLQDDRFENAMD